MVELPRRVTRAALERWRHERPRVAVGIPMTEFAKRTAVNQFLYLFKHLRDDDVFLPVRETAIASDARNTIIREFLKLPDEVEYLFLFDDDMVIDIGTIELMTWRRVPFLSGLAVRKEPPFFPTHSLVSGEKESEPGQEHYGAVVEKHHIIVNWEPHSGLREAHGVGAACLCLRRDLLQAIEPPYFMFGQGGGEDLYFCRKVREAGFQVLVDTSVMPGHIGERVATYKDWLPNRESALEGAVISAADVIGKDAA